MILTVTEAVLPVVCCALAIKALVEFFFDKLEDEVDDFVHARWKFFFDRAEILCFGLGVIVPVLAFALAPTAGVERIDEGGSADEVEGVDNALVVDTTLPEIVEAVLAFEHGDGFIHVHQGAFFTA